MSGVGSSVQLRPSGLIDAITPDVQLRNEPNFAHKSVTSLFQALPGLRAFWPMSSVGYQATNQAVDIGGAGYHLTNNNTATFGYSSLVPYAGFNGTTQYLSRVDGGAGNWADIIGNESFIASGQRGLTLGGWFWLDASTGSNQWLVGKATGSGANRSYHLIADLDAGSYYPQISVASGGANHICTGTAGTTGAFSYGAWYWVAGRYDPAAGMEVWLDAESNTEAVVPATINDTTAALTVGASAAPANYLDGRASMVFLCACAVSDAILRHCYEQSRVMFSR